MRVVTVVGKGRDEYTEGILERGEGTPGAAAAEAVAAEGVWWDWSRWRLYLGKSSGLAAAVAEAAPRASDRGRTLGPKGPELIQNGDHRDGSGVPRVARGRPYTA